ncbi:MAG: hypothetical protein AB8H47_30590 [Bacteroidia bacterium]
MKILSVSFLLVMIMLPFGLVANPSPTDSTSTTATIYVLRPVAFLGDINPHLRLSTNMGHELSIQEGTLHKLEVYESGELQLDARYWFLGKGQYHLTVEAGKTYYLLLDFRTEVLVENPVILETTKSHFDIEKQKISARRTLEE